ncbi:unnamed protein product [Calicophoron daubneyi]|uniref:Nucleoside phosphorylase domain-containing protein n=1 Tax=Calicophoron daubneyi TaxID=300641 RepID=A0AAV2TC96_CALDB
MTAHSPIPLRNVNKNLERMNEDVLYHLGMSTKTVDFKKTFGDVRFVCVGGSASRMRNFAQCVAHEAGISTDLPNLAAKGGRFSLYKVGSVIAADHGMGTPSMSILLHELFKLLHYAGCTDVTFFRTGSCGGIGLPRGSLVISTECLNTQFKPVYELHILGKIVNRPTYVEPSLTAELLELSKGLNLSTPAALGKTVCANDFYEEQARSDGAFCSFTEEEKQAFLTKAYHEGVRNFEMECTCFSAQCHLAGFKAAIVCVTLVDRLSSDQISMSTEEYENFQQLPGKLVMTFLQKHGAFDPQKN